MTFMTIRPSVCPFLWMSDPQKAFSFRGLCLPPDLLPLDHAGGSAPDPARHGQGLSTFLTNFTPMSFPGQKLAGCFSRNGIAIGAASYASPGPAVALDGPGTGVDAITVSRGGSHPCSGPQWLGTSQKFHREINNFEPAFSVCNLYY